MTSAMLNEIVQFLVGLVLRLAARPDLRVDERGDLCLRVGRKLPVGLERAPQLGEHAHGQRALPFALAQLERAQSVRFGGLRLRVLLLCSDAPDDTPRYQQP